MTISRYAEVVNSLVLPITDEVNFVQDSEHYDLMWLEVDGIVEAMLTKEQLESLYFNLGRVLTHMNQIAAGWRPTALGEAFYERSNQWK